MAVFYSNTNDPSEANHPNQEAPEEQNLLYLGTKYKTAEELDQAYAHANDHIGKIENENKELREKLEALQNQGGAVEKVLEAIKGKSEVQEPALDQPDTHQGMTKEELESVVANLLNKEKQQTQAERNHQVVREALEKQFGDKAAEIYQQKAKELNADLDALSATSPQLVTQLFAGAQPKPAQNGFDSDLNTSQLANGPAVGTKAYYDALYKEGKISREEKFRQEHKALSQLGPDKFFGRT